MSKEPFEHLPDVLDARQLAEALQISKAGAYNLLNSEDFPTLRLGPFSCNIRFIYWGLQFPKRSKCK